jgi:MYXO-CTERM domain-containing protein
VADNGGDIFFVDDIGTLKIDNTTFDAFGAEGAGGSIYLDGVGEFRSSSWGGEGGDGAEAGGAIYASGELECVDCDFSDTYTHRLYGEYFGWWSLGGAVLLDSDQFTTWARFEDCTFEDTFGAEGGAIAMLDDVSLSLETSEFLGTLGYHGGAIQIYGAEGSSDPYRPRFPFNMRPSEVEAKNCLFDGVEALNGGAFYVHGMGNTAQFEDCTFTDAHAGWGAFNGLPARPGWEESGFGGVGVVEPGNALAIRDSVISLSTAETWGGVLYSGWPFPDEFYLDYYDGNGVSELAGTGRPIYGAPLPRVCGDPYWYDYIETFEGSDIVLDGVTVSDSGAEGASVAYFGLLDHVTVTGSEFTRNVAVDDGTFYGDNVERLEMSCNTFCNNQVGGRGSVLYLFDDGFDYTPDTGGISVDRALANGYEGGGEGYARDIRYSFENNVVQNNVGGAEGGTIEFEFCGGGAGSVEDTYWVDTVPQVAATFDTSDTFDTSNPWYQKPRGRFDLVNNTFLENDGSMGLVYGSSADVRLGIKNNIFQDGGIGVNLYESLYIAGGYNLWYGLTDDSEGVAEDLFPDIATAVEGAMPVYFDYQALACDSELYLMPASPGVDVGDPVLEDWDDTRSDMGAFGGPGACIPDDDLDGFNAIVDCNDSGEDVLPADGTLDGFYVNPDMPEIPYDGIDQDCDGADLCDVDGDGFAPTYEECTGPDCNDADATIFPGAVDTPYDGIDQDCSGEDECDADGDGFLWDDAACGGHDCDDTDNTVYPGAPETPDDSIDQDCSGADAIADVDGDGYDSPDWGGTDCDDDDADINPGEDEIPYDGIDQDCDGEDECDVDDDGQIADAENCGGDDCDDNDATIGLGFDEVPYDEIDQDCDGEDLCDVDCDGFDADNDACGGDDCADDDPSTHPDALDNPLDDIDQDCNGEAASLYVTGGCDCDTGGSAPWTGAGLLGMLLAFVRRRRDAVPGPKNGRG